MIVDSPPGQFKQTLRFLHNQLMMAPILHRGTWQAQDVSDRPEMDSLELDNVQFSMAVPEGVVDLIDEVDPNMPWAEVHFNERISGVPLNPPPSHTQWPFAQKANGGHLSVEGEKFSHTYPERFWPKWAHVWDEMKDSIAVNWEPHPGIRFYWGDADDLVNLLVHSPLTRQAYLPIWFPEDLTAAREGQRVPCTLGYHFIVHPVTHRMNITYYIRSCDMMRHFQDDVYMAGRLLQWVCQSVRTRSTLAGEEYSVTPGRLVMNIANAHIFRGDVPILKMRYKHG